MTVFEAFLYGLGICYGLSIIGIFSFLKQVLFESAFEWAHEWYEQTFVPARQNELRSPRAWGIGEVVIISDLHIDTWDFAAEGRIEREARFLRFLETIEKTSMDLYINGDLLDAPPNPTDRWEGPDITLEGSILPKYEQVLTAIWRTNNRAPDPLTVTYLYGNHDMAGSGLRYDLVRRPQLLTSPVPFNKAWYPNLVLGVPYDPEVQYGQEQYRFFIDHGHFYDPVLLLYLRDFLIAALSGNVRRALTSITLAGQRRTAEQQSIPRPGIALREGATFDQRVGHWIVRYRWRWKARRTLIQRNADELRQGHKLLTGVLFGHTHLPDSYTFRTGRAKGMTYVNTGDWSGGTGHGTYTIITQDGVVKRFDWLNPGQRAEHHREARNP